MKLQQLKFFVAVYEERSFSAGAVRVNATQSGLSMHVRQLENRYGVVLLNRSSTGVTPTEAGRAFYRKALQVLRAAASAEETLEELSGAVSEQINVGLMPTFTGSVLSPTLLRYSRHFPHVRVSIHEAYSGPLSAQVVDGVLDFAVVPAVHTGLALDTVRMGEDRECFVTAATSPAARLADVAPLRLVLPTSGNARRPRIDHYLAINGIEVAETMELDAMLGTLDIVANSHWVSILPSILGRADEDGVKRRFAPLADPPLGVEYMRISHKARPLNRAARAFAEILQEELDLALVGAPSGAPSA